MTFREAKKLVSAFKFHWRRGDRSMWDVDAWIRKGGDEQQIEKLDKLRHMLWEADQLFDELVSPRLGKLLIQEIESGKQ